VGSRSHHPTIAYRADPGILRECRSLFFRGVEGVRGSSAAASHKPALGRRGTATSLVMRQRDEPRIVLTGVPVSWARHVNRLMCRVCWSCRGDGAPNGAPRTGDGSPRGHTQGAPNHGVIDGHTGHNKNSLDKTPERLLFPVSPPREAHAVSLMERYDPTTLRSEASIAIRGLPPEGCPNARGDSR